MHLDLASPHESEIQTLAQADAIVHLAWGNLPNYVDPVHLEHELPQQLEFVDRLIGAGARMLVISGTCLEYGMRDGVCEESMKTKAHLPYAQAKDLLRKHLESLRERKPFGLAWGRLFYMFGEGQSSHSLWRQLRDSAASNQATFPMSGGQQVRDFLPVTEAARRLALMALAGMHVGTVNICSGIPRTVEHTVREWIRRNCWRIEPELGRFKYPDYEPFAFWGSTDRWRRIEADAESVLSGDAGIRPSGGLPPGS